MKKIFITGESGTIPLAIQKQLLNNSKYQIVNSQLDDRCNLKPYKDWQSFKVREKEINFLDRDLLFNRLDWLWKDVDIIIHSGAFVGTDFCADTPESAIKANVEGTNNIVDICNKFNIKLCYFSTTAILNPGDYSETNPMTEGTEIEPQTLYGITKYSGEQIVKKLCKTEKMVIRPVFGFSDYPDDLHSALTKAIYLIYHNGVAGSHKGLSKKLEILLDTKIKKSYTRVENIGAAVINLIDQEHWSETFHVGENYDSAVDWPALFTIIKKSFREIIGDEPLTQWIDKISIDDPNIIWKPELDYLHWHNMNDSKISKNGCKFVDLPNYISLSEGIKKTCQSVIKNYNKKPYWI